MAVHNKHNGNWAGKPMLVSLTNLHDHDHNTSLLSKLNFFTPIIQTNAGK